MLPQVDRQVAALCPPSPTGKHHWMIESLGVKPTGVCKWCQAERRFENSAGEGYWDYRTKGEREARRYLEESEKLF